MTTMKIGEGVRTDFTRYKLSTIEIFMLLRCNVQCLNNFIFGTVHCCRSLNQRIMEFESEMDDLRNQQKASNSDQDSELGKKYKEHL